MKQGKTYRFFYHFNKQKQGMTVHFRGQCIIAKNVVCSRQSETKWNPKKQPMLVMQGFCKEVQMENDTIYIK